MKIDLRIPEPVQPIIKDYLRKIHQSIEKIYPRWKMSGSYVQASDLGKLGNDLRPYPQFHDGVLYPTVHKEINSVTWWELKNHGIPIVGTPSGALPFTVSWDVLISEMRENLNTYWRSWTRRPRRIAILYSDWGIQWAYSVCCANSSHSEKTRLRQR